MRSKLGLVLLASATLAACNHNPAPPADAGVAAVNVPVVSRSDFVFDASAPGGLLSPTEAARLDAWFQSLNLGYGDTIYVDAAYADAARDQVAQIAANYGMLVSAGAPVTAGMVPPGTIRVVVSRTVASVPGCPNWERRSSPNYDNRSVPNYGCAVNSNLAAMVANPEDLVHGREGTGVIDAQTATRAIQSYRTAKPTGEQGLQDISTKKED